MSATRIYGNLYQGGVPPMGDYLRNEGFDVLVLCAAEFQPSARRYPGVIVLHCPLVDEEKMSERDMQSARRTADMVAVALKQGKKCLVTCYMGWNRSGLVNGLTLHKAYSMKGRDAVNTIRSMREHALSNRFFARVLSQL